MSGMLAHIVFVGNIRYLLLGARQRDPSDSLCWIFVRFRVFVLPWLTVSLKLTYRVCNFLWCKALYLTDLQSSLVLLMGLRMFRTMVISSPLEIVALSALVASAARRATKVLLPAGI